MSIERCPTLCIVAGPNGSGKTTTTLQLLESEWSADSTFFGASFCVDVLQIVQHYSDKQRQ